MPVSYQKQSGSIDIVNEETHTTVKLKEYIGTLVPDSTCRYLRVVCEGRNRVTSNIEVKTYEKIDYIRIVSDEDDENAYCELQDLKATSVDVYCDCTFRKITGNAIKLRNTRANASSRNTAIVCVGHIWAVDSTLTISSDEPCIKTPYLLLDNVKFNLSSTSGKAVDSKNNISFQHCENIQNSGSTLVCEPTLCDDNKDPISFDVYKLVKQKDGTKKAISRRKLFEQIPAQHVNDYDLFKHSTEYTNVDLHRWMDQEGERYTGRMEPYIRDRIIKMIVEDIYTHSESEGPEAISDEVIRQIVEDIYKYDGHSHEYPTIDENVIRKIVDDLYGEVKDLRKNGYTLDEVNSRNYALGIYSLYSIRTTYLPFYEENNPITEDRELP